MASEEYKESEISKIVKRLMDEEGFEFGEAVREAMEQTKNFESKANGGSIGIEVLFGPKREKFNMGGGQFTSGGNISPGTDKKGNVRDDNPFTGGGGGDGPPPVIISKDNTPESITFNEITGKKMLPADLAIQKQFLNLVKKKGYESGLNTEADDLYAAYRSATGLDDFQTNALVNSTTNILDKEKDGVFETFVDRNSTITDLDTGKSTKQLMVETPTSFTRRTVRPSGIMENDIAQPFGAPQSLSVDPYSNIIGSKLKDGGRVGLFMGGPALTGPALGIYNSMKAYQSFTDQEIADAIRQAGYELPTSSTPADPPPGDSTPGQGGGGGGGGDGVQNIIGGSSDTGYSPSQNVAEFQAYKDKINNEAMGSPFTSGPMVDQMNDKIVDKMRSQNPNLNKYTNAEIVSMNPDMFNVGEVEDLSTFGKMKGSFNTGIRSLIDSPIGKVAGFALNPALGLAKGIIGAIPSATPVGRVGNRNIYGVGSFGGVQGSINRENQTALNKTGNFTNFQLGNMTDPGRVAGDPTKNVFAGMNAQSAFGDISKGAQSRIDTISKTLERQKKAGKTPSKVLTERKAKFEKQLLDHNTERARSREDKSGATGTKKGGFTNPGKNSYGPHKGGGGGGGGGGCFLKGTLITMLDGTRKPVEQVDLGNKVAIGGKVFATGKFLVENLHDYKGIKVSGSHMVNEDNKWVRVEDSKHGKPLGDDEHTVYVFGSENRRILINGILFTDYFETKEQEKLIDDEKDFFDNWKSYDKKIDLDNINTLNAN